MPILMILHKRALKNKMTIISLGYHIIPLCLMLFCILDYLHRLVALKTRVAGNFDFSGFELLNTASSSVF